MNLKLKTSTPVEALRDQVRAQAIKDSRFNKATDDKTMPPGGGCWVCDLIAPEAGGDWTAVIQTSAGKLFEVPFTITAGAVTLGATSREVFRSVRYLPLAARNLKSEDLPVALQARCYSEISSAEEPWMFAPGGTHTINCGAGDGAAEVTLRIDSSTAVILNAKLQEINERNAPQRAYIDKEHDQAAGATTWPTKLYWSETPQPGVYLAHQPSDLGKQLVGGKVLRAFSPSFYSDAELPKKVNRGQHLRIAAGKRGSVENPARMTGLIFPACGTITNDPAFRKILPLWAKHAGQPPRA